MTNQRPFPLELLKQSSREKLTYFKNITVPHRNLKDVLNELKTNILEPVDTLVYLVFGVTGVGKTKLRLYLEKILLEKLLGDLRSNPGQIAVAGVEAVSAAQGKFSHEDYYYRALEALKEVLIDYKVDYGIPDADSNSLEPLNGAQSRTSTALRRAMEKAFKHRQLRAFMVDEAQHLFAMAGGRQLGNQMNWIKSIANLTQTVHVLFGTYELLNCSTVNGQVGRRSEDFHLARYIKEGVEDSAEFTKVTKTFGRHLPLFEEPQLEKHCEYLIDYSIGCIGILKSWLVRALHIALEDDAKKLALKHLKKGELSPARRKQIRQEAEAGERRLASILKEDDKSSTSNPQQMQATRSQSNSRRVGQRNPQRDLVGDELI